MGSIFSRTKRFSLFKKHEKEKFESGRRPGSPTLYSKLKYTTNYDIVKIRCIPNSNSFEIIRPYKSYTTPSGAFSYFVPIPLAHLDQIYEDRKGALCNDRKGAKIRRAYQALSGIGAKLPCREESKSQLAKIKLQEGEIIKDVKGFAETYSITNFGRCFNKLTGEELEQSYSGSYLYVNLCKHKQSQIRPWARTFSPIGEKNTKCYVHVLVYKTFKGLDDSTSEGLTILRTDRPSDGYNSFRFG